MASTYNMHDAKTHLSRLAQRAADGEEIVIARNGTPIAKLVAADQGKPLRLGLWRGKVSLREDFDDPLPFDIQRHFEGRDD